MHWRKKLGSLILTGAVAVSSMVTVPSVAYAKVDPWMAAAGALASTLAYKSCLASILDMGNNAYNQIVIWKQDMAQNGRDDNENNHVIVDNIMNRLVKNGKYVLAANSLPFIWDINNSNTFNAACYPTNYITINKGLVMGMRHSESELASVLAHEMVHGIKQHSANNYATAASQMYGAAFLGMAVDNIDWTAIAGLVDYNVMKNVTLPSENEADKEGFYLLASAGFNPGGFAAAMYRMDYYTRYETTDIWERRDKETDKMDLSDHPDISVREARMSALITEYSAGHVRVQEKKNVFIDGTKLITAERTSSDYDNTPEEAYLIAGGLAKAFHDYKTPAEWNFRTNASGSMDFLDDSEAYSELKEAVERRYGGQMLKELVEKAYASEKNSGGRLQLEAREREQDQKLRNDLNTAQNAKKDLVKQLRHNSDIYSDFGMADKALFQMDRVFKCVNQDDPAENYAILGRAKAVQGKFTEALVDMNKAVEMDSKNIYNFLNRADVYRMMGNLPLALADVQKAKEIDSKTAVTYKLMGDIYDDMNNHQDALESYRQYLKLLDGATNIPEEYLFELRPDIKKRVDEEKKEKLKAEAKEKKQADIDKAKEEKESSKSVKK